jgi:hypothetical protein
MRKTAIARYDVTGLLAVAQFESLNLGKLTHYRLLHPLHSNNDSCAEPPLRRV